MRKRTKRRTVVERARLAVILERERRTGPRETSGVAIAAGCEAVELTSSRRDYCGVVAL